MKTFFAIVLSIAILGAVTCPAPAVGCDSRPSAKLCKQIKKFVNRVDRAVESFPPGPLRSPHIRDAITDIELAFAEATLCMEVNDKLEQTFRRYADLAMITLRIDAIAVNKLTEKKYSLLRWCP